MDYSLKPFFQNWAVDYFKSWIKESSVKKNKLIIELPRLNLKKWLNVYNKDGFGEKSNN